VITITTPDIPDGTLPAGTKRIETLVYNDINQHGEIKSTIVFMSDTDNYTNGTTFNYRPAAMHNNSYYEKLRTMVGTSTRWATADIIDTELLALEPVSKYTVSAHNRFDVLGPLSPERGKSLYMHDGWYTLMTLCPPITPDPDPVTGKVLAGTLRSDNFGISYALVDDPAVGQWSSITDIHTDVPIANYLRNYIRNMDYVMMNMFIVTSANKLYLELLNKFDAEEYFSGAATVGAKIKTIDLLVKEAEFGLAQYILNSMSTTLITT
jgi:hypothetical protein